MPLTDADGDAEILDISPTLRPSIAVWPGDVPYARTAALAIDAGANIDLSAIHTTVHVGAHTDAPSHYVARGEGIATRPLSRYLGPCEVVRVDVGRGERVRPHHLTHPPRAARVLFHTGTYPNPDVFNEDFAALSPELIDALAGHGVVLVGIDTPSIDLCHDKVLHTHLAVARHDLSVLEGIVLDEVAAGVYELIALPLKLDGADASPVRAVLVRRGGRASW